MWIVTILLLMLFTVSSALPTSVGRVHKSSSTKTESHKEIVREYFTDINYLIDEALENEDPVRISKVAVVSINFLIRSLESSQKGVLDLFDIDENEHAEQNPITTHSDFTSALFNYRRRMKIRREDSLSGKLNADYSNLGEEGYFYCQLLINCLEFIKESVKTNGGKNLVELLGEISDTSLFGHVLKQKF